MRSIYQHENYKIGDKVRINFNGGGHEDGCEVLEMWETREGRVRVCCKLRTAAKIDIDSSWVEFIVAKDDGLCKCDLQTIMSSGCLCGGN